MEEVVFLFFSKRSNLAGLFGTHWCCSSALCPRSVGASCGIRWKVFLFFFRWSILLLVIETKENEEEIQINSSGCRCCAVVWFLVLVFFNAMISDRWGLNWIGEVTYAVVKTLLVDECAPIYLTFKLGCQPDLGRVFSSQGLGIQSKFQGFLPVLLPLSFLQFFQLQIGGEEKATRVLNQLCINSVQLEFK